MTSLIVKLDTVRLQGDLAARIALVSVSSLL